MTTPAPTQPSPFLDEPTFAAILDGMVADEAPRLFAIVQEYGERLDGAIAAWGLAFDGHAEVVAGDVQSSHRTPEDALRLYHRGSAIRARLVWFNPAAATPASTDADR